MPTTKPKSNKRAAVEAESEPLVSAETLSRLALGLLLAIALVRATLGEVSRPLDVNPGSQPVPRPAGPATSLVLDLLAWLPAMLLMIRAAVEREFRLRWTWSHALFAGLGLLAVLSTTWASNRFTAVVGGFHLLSAAVFLWAASQVVNTWRRLRVVAAVCAGLLLVHGAQAVWYRFVELPEMRQDWLANREQRLREQGHEPDTPAAAMFEGKVLRGEMMGFHSSPNSFAAVTVLLMVVTAGVIVQRLRDGDGVGWIVVPAVGLVLGAAIIYWTDSRTALATPLLAAVMLGMVKLFGGWLGRHRRLAYGLGVAGVVVAAAAVIAHGLRHGSLVIDSMTFRWRYWVGASRVFADHPLLGVGWDNFGHHYLGARLPAAAEEVRDPHNFVVRFFSELGVVGGLLALAWMLRLWWELTQPRQPAGELPETPPRRSTPAIVSVVAGALLLGLAAGVDFGFISTGGDAGGAFVTLAVLSRVAGAGLVLAGAWAATTRSLEEPVLDGRRAPWVLYAVLVALAVFLLHNLVDFSMFEMGPMFLFALLAGAALGMRLATLDKAPPSEPSSESLRAKRLVPLAATAAAWLLSAVALVVPVLLAEDAAATGDENLRRQSFTQAAENFRSAADAVPYDARYPQREADAHAAAGRLDAAREALDRATQINPLDAGPFVARAMIESQQPQPDLARLRADYDAALRLDPANVHLRLRYADDLSRLGQLPDARAQYEKALWYNDQLPPDEMERLGPAKVEEVRSLMTSPPT